MSLWTPDGERPIRPAEAADAEPASTPEQLSPEQEEAARQMAAEMAQTRQELLDTEVATLVANHALGLYELAAIHVTAEDFDQNEARLAIDAMAALAEGLQGRLGEVETTVVEALHQIRMAFVQRVQSEKAIHEPPPATD